MKKILIITGRYLPGYKDGGPVRSMKNLTDYLGDEYAFHILASDRDHDDTEPYPNIKIKDWNQVGKAKVYYVPPKGFKFGLIKKLAEQMDLIYVCGCFDSYAIKTLILTRFRKIRKPVVIAAMGLFSPLEFRLKYTKKKLFTMTFNLMGMFKYVYWSATSEREVYEIQEQVKTKKERFFVAEDLPRIVEDYLELKKKKVGTLEIVWISRIASKKNLIGAIEILKRVHGKVNFTIYGSIYDEIYWQKCKSALNKLPHNIQWEYKGEVESEKVIETLRNYHVFLFPTLGENYGHVIQEALAAGCSCILSDQTPWQDLEQYEVGYICRLGDIKKFVEAVEKYISMDEKEMNAAALRALQYAIQNSNKKALRTGYRQLFDSLLRKI